MPDSPFGPRPAPASSFANPRRSTRVEFATPVIMTGRDASGNLFREQTQTIMVNLHGCRLRTTHKVLVGMLFVLECPNAGTNCEAVCVHVWDPPSGETSREIALQLVKPQNLWAIEKPPPDWEEVAENMVVGRLPRTNLSFPPPPAPVKDGATSLSEPAALPTVDLLLGELEQRAAQLMEYVLQLIRNETDEVLHRRLQEFRQQVDIIAKDAESRIQQGAQNSITETQASLDSLRAEVVEQIAARTEALVESAERTVRAKVGELFETLVKPYPNKPTEPPPRE
jgi:hypothetical protein